LCRCEGTEDWGMFVQTKNYKLLVYGMFKQIKSHDFSTITVIDREKAASFYARYLKIKEERKNNKD